MVEKCRLRFRAMEVASATASYWVAEDESTGIVGAGRWDRESAEHDAAAMNAAYDLGFLNGLRAAGERHRGLCAAGCGRPALDGHMTCGAIYCDEGFSRVTGKK